MKQRFHETVVWMLDLLAPGAALVCKKLSVTRTPLSVPFHRWGTAGPTFLGGGVRDEHIGHSAMCIGRGCISGQPRGCYMDV